MGLSVFLNVRYWRKADVGHNAEPAVGFLTRVAAFDPKRTFRSWFSLTWGCGKLAGLLGDAPHESRRNCSAFYRPHGIAMRVRGQPRKHHRSASLLQCGRQLPVTGGEGAGIEGAMAGPRVLARTPASFRIASTPIAA